VYDGRLDDVCWCFGGPLSSMTLRVTGPRRQPEKPCGHSPRPEPITAICPGADVWSVTRGVIKKRHVIIKGSKIDKVGGPELRAPDGATVIDATGMVLAPGFIIPSGRCWRGLAAVGEAGGGA